MAAHLEASLAQNGSQNSDTPQDVTEQSNQRLYYFIYRLGEVTRGATSIKSDQTLLYRALHATQKSLKERNKFKSQGVLKPGVIPSSVIRHLRSYKFWGSMIEGTFCAYSKERLPRSPGSDQTQSICTWLADPFKHNGPLMN